MSKEWHEKYFEHERICGPICAIDPIRIFKNFLVKEIDGWKHYYCADCGFPLAKSKQI